MIALWNNIRVILQKTLNYIFLNVLLADKIITQVLAIKVLQIN